MGDAQMAFMDFSTVQAEGDEEELRRDGLGFVIFVLTSKAIFSLQ
jgi:hypothetical protein